MGQDHETSRLFPRSASSSAGCTSSKSSCRDNDEEQSEPPASVLTRRQALVPPKIPPYNIDSSDETEPNADRETLSR